MRWITLMLLCVTAVGVQAADSKGKRGKGEPVAEDGALPTLMVQRGKLLMDDPMTAESWAKNWRAYKGGYEIVDEQLRVAERKDDGHHPEASHGGPFRDCVVQCRFKPDGCPWMGIGFSDKEHILRIMVHDSDIELVQMSGIGSTTKGNRLDRMPMKWEKDRWYTLVIEVRGPEVLVHIDSQFIMFGEAQSFDVSKGRLALLNGGQYAWYDDIKIWECEPDPKWEKRKPLVLKEVEKRK